METAEGAEPKQTFLSAVYAQGKIHVEQDDVHWLLLEQSGGGVWARQGENLLECTAQTDFQRREYRRIIVDDKKGSIFHIFYFIFSLFLFAKVRFFSETTNKNGIVV